jgi:predicted neuraminidase
MNRRQFIKTASAASLTASFMARSAGAQPSSTYLDYLGIDLAKGAIQSDLSDLVPYQRMQIAGVHVESNALPRGLKHFSELGVVMPDWVNVRVIHRFPQPDLKSGMIRRTGGSLVEPGVYLDCPRPLITPQGDYLLTIISGKGHYGGTDPHQKVNDILIYRSKDKGSTWQGPFLSTNIPYNQHAWVPLVPRGGKRIYMFSTEPAPDDFNGAENAGIGFRHSDDDGYTWSSMTRIRPVNDPGFQGMWCINMTETDRGTWLLAPHEADWTVKPPTTHLYVLRSTDQGRTWELLPGKRPAGWQYRPLKRMDEGRPLALGHGKVVLFVRTPEGHIWQLRSADDGKTWSEPAPTSLVHPDAPPMIEKLSDGKTLIALFHNRHTGGTFNRDDRSELWVSLSHDDGLSWDQPRFLAVTSTTTTRHFAGTEQYCMTYCDVLADHGQLHIFIPHLWRQILEVRMSEKDLMRLPTKSKLFG